jgi:Xaa-Pro aminopeptidase
VRSGQPVENDGGYTGAEVGIGFHEPGDVRQILLALAPASSRILDRPDLALQDVLEAGNVVSVEPGIYLPGLGGIRIEDMVLITDDGRERLTQVGKELITVR